MRYGHWMLLLAVVAIGTLGCGDADKSGTPAENPPEAGTGENSGDQAASPSEGAAAAVRGFLDAVRVGDDEKAAAMLTPIARQKTAAHGMVVSPPGSDTARFELGEVEVLADDGARVTSLWTDTDASGAPHTDRMVWMVRKVSEGWRVAGVAAVVFEGEAPLLLNFEDPEEMARKQVMLREEIRNRAAQAQSQPQQAQKPADAFQR